VSHKSAADPHNVKSGREVQAICVQWNRNYSRLRSHQRRARAKESRIFNPCGVARFKNHARDDFQRVQ